MMRLLGQSKESGKGKKKTAGAAGGFWKIRTFF
jgi:hypothetical protein